MRAPSPSSERRPGGIVELLALVALLGSAGTYIATLIQMSSMDALITAQKHKILTSPPPVAMQFTNKLMYMTEDKKWQAMMEQYAPQIPTDGSGKVKLTSMYQNLFCVDVLRLTHLSLHLPNETRPSWIDLADACVDQIRQVIECNGDPVLEPTILKVTDKGGKMSPGLFGAEATHTCRDWRTLQTKAHEEDPEY